jgi:hypothetical protein
MRDECAGSQPDAGSGAFEAISHFQTRTGHPHALPAFSILRMKDGLVHLFRFVMDATPITGAQAVS